MNSDSNTVRMTAKNRADKRDASTIIAKYADNPATIKRHVNGHEAAHLIATINANPQATRIRVYSSAGFVPNSYRYPCPIQWIEAVRTDNIWTVTMGTGDAKRPGGNGPRCTVDGKAN